MCWSKNVSLTFTILGTALGYYSYNNIDKLWGVSIYYFTLMQMIHYLGYIVINKCNNNLNYFLTYLNYIHIAFQPFFSSLGFYGLFRGYKILSNKQLETYKSIIIFSLIPCLFLLLKIIPFEPAYKLDKTNGVYNGKACSYQGKYHISFRLPLRTKPYYVTPSMFSHMLFLFGPFLLFNNITRLIGLFLFVTAIGPSFLLNIDPAETSSLWCSNSIAQFILSILIIKFLKKN
tara:strand:+ start:227 stop:922 length:696 start_codon:yes stop_codon:yes gene_type:complete